MKLPSIQQMLSAARESFLRFPLVIITALVGTAVAIILTDYEGPGKASVLFNILYSAFLGIPLLLAIALTVEANRWAPVRSLMAQGSGIIVLIIYGFMTPSYLNDIPLIHLYRFLLFFAAAHCLTAALPFIRSDDQNGFWRFNIELLNRLFVSVFYSMVLMAGLSIGMAALEHLFGVNISGKRYAEINLLIAGVFNTWFFLAGVPRTVEESAGAALYPKGMKIFSQYILAPLVLVYLVILYAYIIKIAFLWAWPQGWVSRLIVGFSGMGMLALLFLFPLRDMAEHRWVKALWRWFFIVLIPLIVLLPLAVLERVTVYGITEGRYLGLALALWLAAMALYFLVSKRKRIQMIPASLSLGLVLIGVGPWSAFQISENDQRSRLEGLLTKNGILVGGMVEKAKASVSIEDARRISSMVQYIGNTHGYQKIQPWFHIQLQSDSATGIPKWKTPADVTRLMGIEFVSVWSTGNELSIALKANAAEPIDTKGFDRAFPARYVSWQGDRHDAALGVIGYMRGSDPASIIFTVESAAGKQELTAVNVEEFSTQVLKEFGNTNVNEIPRAKMSVTREVAGRSLRIYFHNIQLRRTDGKMKPVSCNFEILYTEP